MTRRDPMVAIYHMRDHARDAWEISQDYTRSDLDTNRLLNLGLVRAVVIVGEAASRVPEDFRSRHPQIPWQRTRSLRNRLVHAYDDINFDTLWDIIQNDIPPLIEQLEDLIARETDNS